MTDSVDSARAETGSVYSNHNSALTVDADSMKKVSRSRIGKKKSTVPWKSGVHGTEDDGIDMQIEGDTVSKDVTKMSPRMTVVDKGSGIGSIKVLVPKKTLEVFASPASGKTKRKPGRPPKGSISGLVSNGAGLSKRGAHLKVSSSPTQ